MGKKAVHFGGGNIGRGFVAEKLFIAGFEVRSLISTLSSFRSDITLGCVYWCFGERHRPTPKHKRIHGDWNWWRRRESQYNFQLSSHQLENSWSRCHWGNSDCGFGKPTSAIELFGSSSDFIGDLCCWSKHLKIHCPCYRQGNRYPYRENSYSGHCLREHDRCYRHPSQLH